MSMRLKELIHAVRNCKTAQEERGVVAKECAAIRTALAEQHPYRARNVAKLMYIHMLGYPTEFGQIECITLISSPEYPEKRIGYLALMILLDEDQEVLPLIEHSLKKDLDDKNQFIQSLALTTIANIASADICRDLSPDVDKLFLNAPSYIRKKAAICAMRMVKKCPEELAENYVEKLDQVYQNEQHQRNHGVMIGCIALTLELCRVKNKEMQRKHVVHFRKYIPVFCKILKGLLNSSYALEHDIAGIADPFLQTSLLKLLRILGRGSVKASEAMNDVLAQVATNTEGSKNPGNAILYECVRTIMEIESEKGLRVLGINQLGKFLVNRDNNLRYVALNSLAKVVEHDAGAVNRHLNTIVECLKDFDTSIRQRALELIYLLVNPDNVKTLAEELLNHLQELSHSGNSVKNELTGTDALRQNLTTKLCTLVEKHAPTHDIDSRKWKLQTFLKIITISGQYVREEVASIFIGLVTQSPELQAEITQRLFVSLRKFLTKPHLVTKLDILVQVAVWCIGEFGDLIIGNEVVEDDKKGGAELLEADAPETFQITPEEILRVLERVMDIVPSENTITRSYVLTAVTKFSHRFPELFKDGDISGALTFLAKYSRDTNLELQQRACEFTKLLKLDSDKSSAVLDRMPAIEIDRIIQVLMAGEKQEKKFSVKRKGDESDDTQSATSVEEPDRSDRSVSEIELISFTDEPVSVSPTNGSSPTPSTQTSQGLLSIEDFFSDIAAAVSAPNGTTQSTPLELPVLSPSRSTQPPPTQQSDKFAGSKTVPVYNKNGIMVRMLSKHNDPVAHPEQVNVITQFSNTSDLRVTNLSFVCAVQKHVKLQLFKLSSDVLEPRSGFGQVTQKMKLENTQHAQTPGFAIKYQIKYQINEQSVVDQGTVRL